MLTDCRAFSFPATPRHFERALGELRKTLDDATLAAKVRFNVEVVFEEIVTNAIRHGSSVTGKVRLGVSIEFGADAIVLTFEDDGAEFDPRVVAEPAPYRSLDAVHLGGLGISMVRKASKSMSYERTSQNCNRLTVVVAVD